MRYLPMRGSREGTNFGMKIRAMLFDMDGTLYDEREFVKGGFEASARYISAKYGLSFGNAVSLVAEFFEGLND